MNNRPALPPNIQLLQRVNALWINSCLYIAASHNLAEIIGEEHVAVENIAAASGLNPDWTLRILRALAFTGIFAQEGNSQKFMNTPMSHCLREDHPQSVKGMVLVNLSPRSMIQYANFHTIVTKQGATVPEQLWGRSLYSLLDEGPASLPVPPVPLESRQLFDAMMDSISNLADKSIVEAYTFSGRVCDLGGSKGKLLAAIMQRYPEVSGILFDRPVVIQYLREQPQPFEMVGGDFFKQVPVADTYIIKDVFHNWPDADAALIMQRCRQANPEATILVIEQLLDDPHGFAPLLDIQMGVEQQGRERTRAEYEQIGSLANYRLTQVHSTKSIFFIMEFHAC